MSELIEKLGIDWKLLLSQAVNFLFLIVILRAFVYRPVVKMLNERKRRIEEGVAKAEESERRLHEVDGIAKGKIQEAEAEALQLFRDAEQKGKKLEAALLVEAHRKESEVLVNAERAARSKQEEVMLETKKNAVRLVKDAIKKTVELDPQKIDEALIEKAVQSAGDI